jgi:hypothetical protein
MSTNIFITVMCPAITAIKPMDSEICEMVNKPPF